jgi:signal peptidase II
MRADIAGWLRALGVCAAVVLVDQVSKAIITSSIAVNHSEALILGFKLTNTSNTGLAFGLGQGHGIVLAVTIAALALVLVWFAMDPTRPGLWLAVGLLAGGAFGNLADRVREHAVTDFINPPFWATFNLADVAITLGAVVLVLSTIGPEAEGETDRGRA